MILKTTGLKKSHKDSLSKVTSVAAVRRCFQKFHSIHRKHLCWSLFLIKLQALQPATLFKRYFNTDVFLLILRIFCEQLFYRTLPVAAFDQFEQVSLSNGSVMGIYQSSLVNQEHNMQCFLLKNFVDPVRVHYSHIVSRNHSNTLFIDLTCRKQKLVQNKALQQKLFVLILGF